MVTPEQVRDYIAAGLACDHLEVSGDGAHFEAVGHRLKGAGL